MHSSGDQDRIVAALDRLRIELPSWGFANTGTRFGKYLQPAAAVTTEEKISDAGHVHALTGCCPTVALHVLWDFPLGLADTEDTEFYLHADQDRSSVSSVSSVVERF